MLGCCAARFSWLLNGLTFLIFCNILQAPGTHHQEIWLSKRQLACIVKTSQRCSCHLQHTTRILPPGPASAYKGAVTQARDVRIFEASVMADAPPQGSPARAIGSI